MHIEVKNWSGWEAGACTASPTSFSCQHFGVTYHLGRASLSIYFMLYIGKCSETLQIPTMNLMTKMLLYVCSLLEGLSWYDRHVRFYIEEIALGHVYRLFYQVYNLCISTISIKLA